MRFDLKVAFLLTTDFCVLAWAIAADHPFAWFGYVTFVQFTTEWYAATRGVRPYRAAFISGFVALAALAICQGPIATIFYLVFGVPNDFFEDGVPFAVLAPLFAGIVFTPLSVVTGFICASIVRGIRHRRRR